MNLFLCFLCLVFKLVDSTEATLRTKSFKYKDNHKSDSRDILHTLSVSSVAKCAYQCTANKDCEDANYDKQSKFCQLLRKKPKSVLLALVEQPGVLYLGDVNEIKIHDDYAYLKKINESSSCKTIYDSGRSSGSKAYNLSFGTNTDWSMVYCMMGNSAASGGCGPGGWTLVMKINGANKVFNFDNAIWTDMTAYNKPAGQTGIEDLTETKMPTFWRTPFTKICLGMKSLTTVDVNWMTIDKTADSLHSLLADGTELTTNLEISAWEALFPDNLLQANSCKEGFNVIFSNIKARIGLIADNSNPCNYPNSCIGVGTQNHHLSTSCGSLAKYSGSGNDIFTNCLIFVQ